MSTIAAKWINKDGKSIVADNGNLAVQVLGTGSGGALEITDNGVNVREAGVTNAMLGGSIALSKLAATVITPDGATAFAADQSMGGYKLTNLAQGVSASDAVTLAQLEASVAGLDFQADVLAVVDPNVNYPGDGTLAAAASGARYALTGTTLNEAWGTITGLGAGDIVSYNGTAWEVAYDVSAYGPGALAWSRADSYFVRWDGTSWSEFGGLSGVTAGVGLTKSGNTISILLNGTDSGLTVTSSGLNVKSDTTGGANLAAAINVSDNGIAVKVDDVTIVEGTSGQLKVADGGIGPTQLDQTGTYDFTSGSVDVATQTAGDSTTKAATTAFVSGAVSDLNTDLPSSTNYTATAATIKGHLEGISNKLAVVASKATEMVAITAAMVTDGYLTLAHTANDPSTVAVTPVGGPRQVNKLAVGTTGVTADYTVISGTQLHINNNGAATDLSAVIGEGDVLIIEYTY